jgi:hypothetical protein
VLPPERWQTANPFTLFVLRLYANVFSTPRFAADQLVHHFWWFAAGDPAALVA